MDTPRAPETPDHPEQQKAERYRALIELTPDAVYEVSADGSITQLNSAFEQLTGWSASEWVGEPFVDLLDPEDRPLAREVIESVLRDKMSRPYHLRIRTKSGDYLTGEFRSAPLMQDDGAGRIIGVVRDITGRRRTEEDLGASRDQLAAILEGVAEGITVQDATGRLLYSNDAAAQLIGYSTAEALMAAPVEEIMCRFEVLDEAGDQMPLERLPGRLALQGQRSPSAVLRYRVLQTGQEQWSQVRARPVFDADGEVRFAVNIFTDITETKRSEEALRESEERYRNLVESAPSAVAVHQDQKLVYVNPAASALVGATGPESLIGMQALDFIHLEHRDWVTALTREARAAGKATPAHEVRLLRLDGQVLDVEMTSIPSTHQGQPATQIVVRDITAHKRTEEALKQNEERLRLTLQAADVGTWDWDIPANKVAWSEALEIRHGLVPGTFDGQFETFLGFIHPYDREEVLEAINGAVAHKSDYAVEYRIISLDGALHWISGKGRVICDEADNPVRMTGVCVDITERKRAEEAQRFLSDASNVLASSLDSETTLRQIARIAVPSPADWCAVDMVDPGGAIRRVAVAHIDDSKVRMAYELGRRYPPDGSSPLRGVIASGEPLLIPEATDEMLVQAARDEEHLAMIRELGLRSAIIMPLKAQGRVLGVVTLIAAESRRRYDSTDLAMIQELARRCAAALENSQFYEDQRRTARQLHLVNEITMQMSSMLKLDDLLPNAANLMMLTFSHQYVFIWLASADGKTLRLAATAGDMHDGPSINTVFPLDRDTVAGSVAMTGETLVIGDVTDSTIRSRYKTTLHTDQTRSHLAVPIKIGNAVLGVLDIRNDAPDAFGTPETVTAEAVSKQLGVAIENAHLMRRTEELAVLEERNRMAREIHDSLAQTLVAMVWHINLLTEGSGPDLDEQTAAGLQELRTMAVECLQETRSTIDDLRPRPLENVSLAEALRNEIQRVCANRPIQSSFSTSGDARPLPTHIEAALLRICQESLSNVIKHAKATNVTVDLEMDDSNVRLTVKDDGCGFDPDSPGQRTLDSGGFGLSSMRERARLLGGQFSIETFRDKGTTVTVILPVG
ncbi:MAG: PAS domain S-box protein [Dehalococcoidia bacterium]